MFFHGDNGYAKASQCYVVVYCASCVLNTYGDVRSWYCLVTFKIVFDVLLTVHLGIFLAVNQPNAQILFFITSLLYTCTCFEHYCSHHQEVKLYYTASGIITPVGGLPVHRLREDCARDGHLQSVMIPDAVQYNFNLLMMSTTVLETCNELIIKQEFVH